MTNWPDQLWATCIEMCVVGGMLAIVSYSVSQRKSRALVARAGYTWVPLFTEYTDRWMTNPPNVDTANPGAGFRGTYRGVDFVCILFKQTSSSIGRWTPIIDLTATFPDLSVRPHIETGPLATLGVKTDDYDDLQVEYEPFNETFHVRSPDPRFANGILHPVLIEQLLAYPDTQWHIRDHELLSPGIVQRYSQLNLDVVHQQLDLLLLVLGSIPRYMWSERGVDPPVIAAMSTLSQR